MHSTAVWTTLISSSLGLALAAQTTVGTVPPPNSETQPAPAAITAMVGCLQRSDQAVHYKLTNGTTVASGGAMMDAAKFTPAVSGNKASDKQSSGPRVTSPDLALVTQVQTIRFDKHVGHQVEVIGTLEQAPAMGATDTTAPPAAAGTTGTTPAESRPVATMGTPTMNVSVMRIIATRCK